MTPRAKRVGREGASLRTPSSPDRSRFIPFALHSAISKGSLFAGYLFISYVHKQLYLIAFVDLVPVATEKVRQSYPVENFLESVEEYSEGKIHKSEPEPGNRNIYTVYFVNQARGNT